MRAPFAPCGGPSPPRTSCASFCWCRTRFCGANPSAGGTVGGAKMTVVGRQIINTGGPARTRYRAIRAAVITLIILVCIAILVFFVRGRRAHPLTPAYGHHARTTSGARPAGATNP